MAALRQQILEQLDFKRVARSEIHVASFGCGRHVLSAIPEEAPYTKTCACCDQRPIALLNGSFVQRQHLVRPERRDSMRRSFEIIDQDDGLEIERARQAFRAYDPGEI